MNQTKQGTPAKKDRIRKMIGAKGTPAVVIQTLLYHYWNLSPKVYKPYKDD